MSNEDKTWCQYCGVDTDGTNECADCKTILDAYYHEKLESVYEALDPYDYTSDGE